MQIEIPIIQISFDDWQYLNNELAIGVPHSGLLLVNTEEIRQANGKISPELNSLLQAKKCKWIVLVSEKSP